MKYLTSLILLLFILSCGPSPYNDAFKEANTFIAQNNLPRAYTILKDICNKEPENAEFCGAYHDIRDKLYNQNLRRTRTKLDTLKSGPQPITKSDLEGFAADIKNIKKYRWSSSELDQLSREVESEKQETSQAIIAGAERSQKLLDQERYDELFAGLNKMKRLDPRPIFASIVKYSELVLEKLYGQITKLLKAEQWKNAQKKLEIAQKIKPNYRDIQDLLKITREKDSADYYIAKAQIARDSNLFDEAIALYERAAEYPATRQKVNELLFETKADFTDYNYLLGLEAFEQGMMIQTFNYFRIAGDRFKELPSRHRARVSYPEYELQEFYDDLSIRAKQAEVDRLYGIAYFYYRLIFHLSPSYPELISDIETVSEKIADRVIKSLAIMPFAGTKSAPEIGAVLTSNVRLNLHKDLSQDVRIIEREAVDVLLKEFEISLASNTGDDAKDISGLQISSTDYLLLGEVLKSGVETSVQETQKMIRAKTRDETIVNPEYTIWERETREDRKNNKQVRSSPRRTITRPVYEDIRYKIRHIKKVAYLTVSYRIVDTSKGKVIKTSVIEVNKTEKDSTNEGIEIGEFKLPLKLAVIPPDVEMRSMVQKDVIKQIAVEIKSFFVDPEVGILKEAEVLLEDGNIQGALEKYADAIILMKRKNKQTRKQEEGLYKYIDAISNY